MVPGYLFMIDKEIGLLGRGYCVGWSQDIPIKDVEAQKE
jgi:hypothetical protein